jgi:competence protein ComEC
MKNNDRSCVLSVEAGGRRVLLPADIERRAEEELLAAGREKLATDVLLAPHHGSRTSSAPEFVRAVAPRVVLFQQGYRNRHGHPHADVLQRYREIGANLYRSDRDGAVTVAIRADGTMSVTPWRAVYRRYWQTEMAGDPVPEPRAF